MVSASESTFEILLDRQFGRFVELADITRAFELDFRQVDASCYHKSAIDQSYKRCPR
jgi:hypothetical protein